MAPVEASAGRPIRPGRSTSRMFAPIGRTKAHLVAVEALLDPVTGELSLDRLDPNDSAACWAYLCETMPAGDGTASTWREVEV
jgi:hypothetical protein